MWLILLLASLCTLGHGRVVSHAGSFASNRILMRASRTGDIEALSAALPRSSTADLGDALIAAVENEQVDVVEYMVSRKIVSVPQRLEALAVAVDEYSDKCAVELVGRDLLDIRLEWDQLGNTLLHLMSCDGNEAMVIELIERGASQEVLNFDGDRYDLYGHKCTAQSEDHEIGLY